MLNLHVVLAVDRAGLVGEDGETHHGVFDVGFLRQVPGMQILAPASCAELKDMLRWAVKDCTGPVAVRYPRGGDGEITKSNFEPGKGVHCHRRGKDVAILTYGTLTNEAMKCAEQLAEQGVEAKVLRLLSVSPLPVREIVEQLDSCKNLLIAEEVCTGSGIHEALSWELMKQLPDLKIHAVDLGRDFVTHGNLNKLYEQCGLDSRSMTKTILEVLGNEN